MDQLGAEGSRMQATLTGMFNQRTVPYVFINGELIGGADATHDAFRDGSLMTRLRDAGINVMQQEL